MAVLSLQTFFWKTIEPSLTEGIKEKQSTCGIAEKSFYKGT